MRISGLFGPHRGRPFAVLGTGPTTRVFYGMDKFLSNCFVIGLNQAWKHYPCDLMVTVHPELYLAYREQVPDGKTPWAVKKKPPMAHLEFDDPDVFVFATSTDLKTVSARPADTLYLGEGVQCTALDLAARMGADFVFVVGCDAASLGGEHHGHDQHVRFLGQSPDDQYALYRKHAAKTRAVLRSAFGLPVAKVSPLLGEVHGDEDYVRLRTELDLPRLPAPRDVSPYLRPPRNRRRP